MEAPIPLSFMKTKDINEYSYSINGEEYLIFLDVDSSQQLKIKVNKKNESSKIEYIYEGALDDLQKLSKYFLLFDNIEEIKDQLISFIENNQIILTKTNNNEIKLNIEINITKRVEKIEFILVNQKHSNEIKVNEILNKISFLEKENKSLRKELNELKELFKDEINEKKLLKNNIKGKNDIITKISQYNLLLNGINNMNNLKNKNMILNLIYKATINGDKSEDFHRLCDGKAPLICVFQTVNNIIFGGYTEKKWSKNNEDEKDQNAFLFSFNNNKIYQNNGRDMAIKCREDKGPYFCWGISIFNKFFEKNKHYVRNKDDASNSWKNFNRDFELNDGNEFFDLRELEVFEVSFE